MACWEQAAWHVAGWLGLCVQGAVGRTSLELHHLYLFLCQTICFTWRKKKWFVPHLQEVLKLTWDWHFRGGTLTMTKANLREVICPSVGKYLQRE